MSYNPTRPSLHDAILVMQRMGVVTFAPDVPRHHIDIYTKHLRAAYKELLASKGSK